ncbi:hypothetical protein CRYUN_Cryun02cG0105600 [Craigia yunnanensis]
MVDSLQRALRYRGDGIAGLGAEARDLWEGYGVEVPSACDATTAWCVRRSFRPCEGMGVLLLEATMLCLAYKRRLLGDQLGC